MSPSSTPSFSAIWQARSGCERPAKTISRFSDPRSIAWRATWGTTVSCGSRPGMRVSSVVAVSVDIAFLRDLPRREACQGSGRDVVGYDGAGRDPCVVADLHRGHERIVDGGPDVAPDLRPLLRLPRAMVEVGRHVRGADIRVLADLGVADVGEVRHLRAGADLRVLHLDERADLRALADGRARTHVSERT